MDISSYLNELIKTRKAVGIPGLGSFYKKKSPGRYDAASHSFLPPSYVLEYTSEVKEDKLLRDFVSKNAQVEPDAAIYHIDQFTSEIKRRLDNGEAVVIGKLGTLQRRDDGYSFSPASNANVGFDFYGMPALTEADDSPSSPIEDTINAQDNATPHKDIQDNQPVYDEISELPVTEKISKPIVIETTEGMAESEADLPISKADEPIQEYMQVAQPQVRQQLPEYDYQTDRPREESKGMPAYLIVILVGAVIFAALIGAYYFKPELFNRSAGNNVAVNNSVPVTLPDTLQTDTASKDSLAKDTAGKLANATDTVPSAAAPVELDTLISYEIIAASLLNKKEADGFLKQMERKGIPAKIANMPGKRIKVSIGTFIDEAEANAQLQHLKQTTKIPGIYIYTKRHTNNIK